ncbi:MAG: peptidoglycan DD-metalloendopeptidase family protein [Chloroflexia bacterium]|nr:peptidoglycan DD-metalloendopeptidase family protein [Chloroflexia bacterium]
MLKLNQPFWQRFPLLVLVLINLAVLTFVVTDVRRRLQLTDAPQGSTELRTWPTSPPASPPPQPTFAPAPTSVPLAAPTAAAWPAENFPATLVDNGRFSWEQDFYTAEIQSFLEARGSILADTTIPIGDGPQVDSFAHVLNGHCLRYSLNPKVVLTLLELQSGAVRGAELPPEQLDWAMGYRSQQWRGLEAQLQWAVFVLADNFRRETPGEVPLLTDGTRAPLPGEANAATQSLLRLLAYTSDRERFYELRSDGSGSFVDTYRSLFGQDPRPPLAPAWEPALQPFLRAPFRGEALISSFFDHEYPIFRQNGSLLPYSGNRGAQSYDGHDGWDYVLPAGADVLAAASGEVVFAGFLDTLCPTPAGLVVLDHGQGYRTLYWHFQHVYVQEGDRVPQGQPLGAVGSTGCSTGPHLHFGVQWLGRDTDPYGWCGSEQVPEDPWAAHPAGAPSRWLWADRPSPCPVPARALVLDDADGRCSRSEALWYEAPVGYAGHAFWTYTTADVSRSTHRVLWRPELPEAGRYFVYAYVPWYDSGRPDTTQARYRIRYAGGQSTVVVDQAHAAGLWVLLGAFNFQQGSDGYVYLDEVTADGGTTIWFDAVIWVRE